MMLVAMAVVGGMVLEYFVRPVGRLVDMAKAVWAKIRG